ncbi:MAG: type IV pilin N-terminal domain-containing protein [Methanomassiliicoccales archaeon]|nr:MAG: type IV pilin N-terminal domain-containing protein [Methanomassiliicoccales archaeon]
MRKVLRDEVGVSPVIAVILLVALTVVLAATLYVMVSGLIETGPQTPNVSMVWKEDRNNIGNYTGNVVSISGATVLRLREVSVVVTHGNETKSENLDVLATGTTLEIGTPTMTLRFDDANNNGKLGGEDNFEIAGGERGDLIRLVYTKSGGQMGQSFLE